MRTGLNNMERTTSFDDPEVGEGTVLHEVVRGYSPFNLLADDWQEHDGAVTEYSPKASYDYSDPEYGDTLRRDSMRYPSYSNGGHVSFDYLGEINNALNRISGIVLASHSETVATYRYAGTGRNTRVEYPQIGSFAAGRNPFGHTRQGVVIRRSFSW